MLRQSDLFRPDSDEFTNFAVEDATLPLELANEIAAFHHTASSTDNFSQMAPLRAHYTPQAFHAIAQGST